ncbi:MAG: hypothetical protein ACK5UC_24285, partial [Planctomycetaceae bacterium]
MPRTERFLPGGDQFTIDLRESLGEFLGMPGKTAGVFRMAGTVRPELSGPVFGGNQFDRNPIVGPELGE